MQVKPEFSNPNKNKEVLPGAIPEKVGLKSKVRTDKCKLY